MEPQIKAPRATSLPSRASGGRIHVNRYPSLRGVQVCFAYLSFDKPFLKVYVCQQAYVCAESRTRRVSVMRTVRFRSENPQGFGIDERRFVHGYLHSIC